MMARLWHAAMLLCCAWSPVCPSSVSFIGSPGECRAARFVPGYNLGGEGFDIVKMQRKGAYVIDTETWKLAKNGTCRLVINRYTGAKQKVPVAVVDWRILPRCSLRISSKMHDSVETLVNDSTSSVSNDWKIGLDVPVASSVTAGVGFGGTHSKESIFGMTKSKKDHYNFLQHSVSCNFYGYRVVTKPPLSREFKSAVNSLPSYSCTTKTSYQHLIETYGTHYITQVRLGGELKATTAIKTCEASIKDLSATDVSDCLSVEASASFAGSVNIKAMTSYCEQKKKKLGYRRSFSSVFKERLTEVIGGHINGFDILFAGQSNPYIYTNWLNSLKTIPDVVQYNIKALHTVLPRGHRARIGLKKEVERYIKKNAVLKKCSESCNIGHRSNRRDPCACVCSGNRNFKSNCCPAGKGLATLKVYKLHARKLYGDKWTETDGSVEISYWSMKMRTAIIPNNDNPNWPETFNFGPITVNMRDRLKFTVYDEDTYWNSDNLGSCSIDLHSGRRRGSCMLNHGTFFFSYEVKCAPNLGGRRCENYVSNPMSASLAKVFYTRNGVLLGESEETCVEPSKSVRKRSAVDAILGDE